MTNDIVERQLSIGVSWWDLLSPRLVGWEAQNFLVEKGTNGLVIMLSEVEEGFPLNVIH